jgi:hypothetical protein
MSKQLMDYRDTSVASCQHTEPCSDCPWARTALRGWLGGQSVKEWIHIAHSDGIVECHTQLGAQCAGIAIYRKNVAKTPRDPSALRLPGNLLRVFGAPDEFRHHHEVFNK